MTTEEFIKRSQAIHGDIYDYSKANYVNNYTQIIIGCNVHGYFTVLPKRHLKGQKCTQCTGRNYIQYTTESFIEKANTIHNYRYDYSLVKYINYSTKVQILCKEHGIFWQIPSSHLKGHGCKKCSSISRASKKTLTTEAFIYKSQLIHNDLYDYHNVVYKSSKEKVSIFCKRHGEFLQSPNDHLNGKGCPKCNMSKGELSISQWLSDHNLVYESQKHFSELGSLSYDFFVPKINLLIEYNGEQHYHFKNYFHKDLHDFHYQKHRDWIKRKFAKSQGLNLLVIPYWDFDKIEDILEGVF